MLVNLMFLRTFQAFSHRSKKSWYTLFYI